VFKSLKDMIGNFSGRVNRLMAKFDGKVKLFDIADDEGVIRKGKTTIGYLPTKDCLYLATSMPCIAHEIAHMVEANENKVLLPDWGLPLFKKWHRIKTASIVSAMARETRVRAIQLHVENAQGKESDRSLADNPVWIDNMLLPRLPYGRFKTRKDIEEWVDDIHVKTYCAWDFDRVEVEWNKRTNTLLNWMETKEVQ
jgi:hypothetical protein